MKCIHPTCPNDVPAGWEGGYCLSCIHAIEDAEADRQAELHWQKIEASGGPVPMEPDPFEEYGFDYPWEMNQ